jgi:hypothetical protein
MSGLLATFPGQANKEPGWVAVLPAGVCFGFLHYGRSGAGGSVVAEMVVEQLNAVAKSKSADAAWTVFDKNLAKQVLVEHKLPLNLEKVCG